MDYARRCPTCPHCVYSFPYPHYRPACIRKPSIRGQGSRYLDGDTITVLVGGRQQLKVRLAEIDAPEKSQAFGQRSKQSLSGLVFGKQVRVEQQDMDRYGRVVGRVYAEGLDVNAEQIRRGMAWVYRQYNRDKSLLALEQEAKNAKRGLWSEPNAIRPWEYRHGGRAGPPAGSKSAQAPDQGKGTQQPPMRR
jgi:endonuclease YncB( thermonuclease family)